jgi:MFS family permease
MALVSISAGWELGVKAVYSRIAGAYDARARPSRSAARSHSLGRQEQRKARLVTVINRRPQVRTTAQKGRMRRVLIAYALYDLVETALWLAIIFYAYDRGGASLAGLAAVIQLVPAALLTPAIAGLGDGMPRGQALSLAHGSVGVAAMMTTVALFLDAPVAVVIAGAAAATLAVSVVRPFHFAALPMLAKNPAELVAANASSSVSDGFSLFAGVLIAGVGVQVAGPAQVFAGAAAAALLAAALCSGLELAAASAGGGGLRVAIDGFAILWRDWLAVVLLLALSMRFVILGALDVLSISFVEQLLGRGESSAGLILAAFGVGGAAGGIAAGRLATRPRLGPVIVVGGIVQGIAVACVAVFATVAPVMAALAVAGFGSAVLMVAGRTLLQRISDDRALARMFAVQETVSLVGLSLGAVLAPALIDRLGADTAFVPFGVATALFIAACVVALRRVDERAVVPVEKLALLRRVAFLDALPQYELERLARTATWIEVEPGHHVIEQGEIGDRFYVVDTGDFVFTIDGVQRPQLLGPGSGFGEIALIRSVPRTATVISLDSGRLLAVDAQSFIAAVTGDADGHALATKVTDSHLALNQADMATTDTTVPARDGTDEEGPVPTDDPD